MIDRTSPTFTQNTGTSSLIVVIGKSQGTIWFFMFLACLIVTAGWWWTSYPLSVSAYDGSYYHKGVD